MSEKQTEMSRKVSRTWYYNATDVYKPQKVPLSVRYTKPQIDKCQMRWLNIRLLNIRFAKRQKTRSPNLREVCI